MLELDLARLQATWFVLNSICFIRHVDQQGHSWIDFGFDHDKCDLHIAEYTY